MGKEIGDLNVNPARVPVPPGLVTATEPEVPAATVAVMVVALSTVKAEAAVPPKVTPVMSMKFVPVMVTTPNPPALVGVKEEMVGVGGT